MECYDTAIIGLGGIGSATAWFAARTGQSVIGLERFDLGGHHRGASHDHSRIIRHGYHTPHYVELTRLAYNAWREAESESSEMCVHITGGIDLFPRGAVIDSKTYRQSMDACDIGFDELSPAEVMTRWPGLVDGRAAQAAHVVVAADAWTAPLIEPLGTLLPLVVTHEQVTYYETDAPQLFAPGQFPCVDLNG